MKLEDAAQQMDFSEIPPGYYLLGLISAFENRFQAMADSAMREISWKQFFLIICVNLCKKPPTIGELSEIVGSSHQNVKQLLLKLEKKEFITFRPDEKDKRKQRIHLTDHCMEFCEKNDEMSIDIMKNMFNGIPEKDIKTTIRTIMEIEKNLRGISLRSKVLRRTEGKDLYQ